MNYWQRKKQIPDVSDWLQVQYCFHHKIMVSQTSVINEEWYPQCELNNNKSTNMPMEFLYPMKVLVIQINYFSLKSSQNQVCNWPLKETTTIKLWLFSTFKFTPKPTDFPNNDDSNQARSYITEGIMIIEKLKKRA